MAYVLPLPLLSRVLSTVLFKTKWGEISPAPHSLFSPGRVFSAKKVCKKGDGGREKSCCCRQEMFAVFFSFSFSFAQLMQIFQKWTFPHVCTREKRKKYKDVVFGRMAEYTFQGFFASRDEKNLPCCSFSHISWAVFVYSQKEKNPPPLDALSCWGKSAICVTIPFPQTLFGKYFLWSPPLLIRRKGGMRRAKRGKKRGRNCERREENFGNFSPPQPSRRGEKRKKKTTSGTFWQLLFFFEGGGGRGGGLCWWWEGASGGSFSSPSSFSSSSAAACP